MSGPLAVPRPPVTITVHGTPAPQGSKRAYVRGTRAVVVEQQHDRVRSWRQAVLDEAIEVIRCVVEPQSAGGQGESEAFPLAGPLELSARFWLRRPKSHYRSGRNAHLIRDSAPEYPAKMPDLDKLLRSTMDALSDAGIWLDDGQVVRFGETEKLYTISVLRPSGADISIRQLEA